MRGNCRRWRKLTVQIVVMVSQEHGGGVGAQSCLTLATPWTLARQAPLSKGFSRQESWSGLPFPSPGDLPNPGIKPWSPVLQEDSLPTEVPGKPHRCILPLTHEVVHITHVQLLYVNHSPKTGLWLYRREVAVEHGEPALALCDDLEGWGGEGKGGYRGRGCMYNYSWFASLYGRNQHNIISVFLMYLN